MTTTNQPSLETLIVVAKELLEEMGPKAREMFKDRVEALEAEIQALEHRPTATEIGLDAARRSKK